VIRGAVLLGLLGLAAAGSAAADSDHLGAATPASTQAILADSIAYRTKVTDNNLMGVTITNYGFIGNNFVSRTPSMEYPLGTAYEHLVRGGLWFGAQAVDDSGAFIGVVCGTVDGRQGSSAQQATEYTPASPTIQVRSALINSRDYSPKAVSEQDYLGDYSDRPARRAADNTENHRPMGILVHQENYAWSFSDYAHLVIFHYEIKNLGPPLANAWVGLYMELASGLKSGYSAWPPTSSTGGGLGGWFNKKWMVYEDSLRLLREHYCVGLPIPGGCNLSLVPAWAGVKVLGTGPEPIDTKQVTLAAWKWEPGSDVRDEDTERYALMSTGTIQDFSTVDLLPGSGDPVEVIATGPFPQINPGEKISVDFAFVGGAQPEDIQRHARLAQRAFDRNYKVPVPPPSPRLKVIAHNNALDLYWDDSPEFVADSTSSIPLDLEGYRVYVGEDRNDLQRIAQFDLATPPHDTTGFNTGFGAVQHDTLMDGIHYKYRYRIPSLKNGFKYFCAVTSYDLGTSEIESLESGISQNKTLAIPGPAPGEKAKGTVYVFPNPYRVEAKWDQGRQVRDHYLWFTNLPERCMLRIYTLSGDLVFQTHFVGADYHGDSARGVFDPASELDVESPTLSGTTFAWDMITGQGQAAATGLYLYSVEDESTHKTTVGKFLIVKSDREGF